MQPFIIVGSAAGLLHEIGRLFRTTGGGKNVNENLSGDGVESGWDYREGREGKSYRATRDGELIVFLDRSGTTYGKGEIMSELMCVLMTMMVYLFLVGSAFASETLNAKCLRCEYLVNPSGIDVTNPRLSWILESSGRGQKQAAYQILVATSEELLAAVALIPLDERTSRPVCGEWTLKDLLTQIAPLRFRLICPQLLPVH